jgi:tRNA pseudouridine13 synthase
LKLRRELSDFVVRELAEFDGGRGYRVYLLRKRGANTVDVLRDVAKKLKLPYSAIGYGGKKDRYSISYQYFTVPEGETPSFISGKNYYADFITTSSVPHSPSMVKGNFFEIRVREVSEEERERFEESLRGVERFGFPNYYGDQRFGSLRGGGDFVAKLLVRREYEEALKTYFFPSKEDRSEIKRRKRETQRLWGRWKEVSELWSGWERRLFEFLSVHPRSFKKSFSFFPSEELLMLMNAYQSFLWNCVLSRMLEEEGRATCLIKVARWRFRCHKEELGEDFPTELPYPSPKLRLMGKLAQVYAEVLKKEGFSSIGKLRTNVKNGLFKSHMRRSVVVPRFETVEVKGSLVLLAFELPSGSYATVLLRRLFSCC